MTTESNNISTEELSSLHELGNSGLARHGDAIRLKPAGLSNAHIAFLEVARNLVSNARERISLELQKQESDLRSHLALKLKRARKRLFARANAEAQRKAFTQTVILSTKIQDNLNQQFLKLEQECTRLAVQIAEAVIQEKIDTATTGLALKVRAALEKIAPSVEACLLVSPRQQASITDELGTLLPISSRSDLKPGQAMLSLRSGEIHINWERELTEIKTSLLGTTQQ